MTAVDAEQSRGMGNDGKQIRERRLRLGMTIEELAKEAGVSPDTLGDFEAGNRQPRELTLSKIVAALDRIEEEVGLDAPTSPIEQPPELFRFIVKDPHGLEIVTVEGPMTNADELRRQAISIIREIRGESGDAEGGDTGEQGS